MDEKSSTDSSETPDPPKKSLLRLLPFGWWWALSAGALAGLALRLLFWGKAGSPYTSTMAAFIYLSPMIVGAVTVYVAETRQRRTWGYYFWAPFVANILYVVGTLLVMIEGWICAVVILPLFAVLGSLGGLIMGAVCRATNWPKQAVLSLSVLPLVLGFVETDIPFPDRIGTVERTTVVHATPERIWGQILNAPDIKPEEVNRAWLFRIGVPVPLTGITQQTPEGPVRRVTMGKGIYFDEVITDWQEYRYLRWLYRFYKDSFPPDALDEHVEVGGEYFDLIETSYTLTPMDEQTELKVQMRYRVSTRFNWYAGPVAQLFLGNVAEANVGYYKNRSESRGK
jgi:hypothetical protein